MPTHPPAPAQAQPPQAQPTDQLAPLEARLGHTFADRALLLRALTHASTTDNRKDSNERLEFLGDAVLGMVCCEMIFELFPDELEGEMTKIKSTVVSRQTCAAIARDLALDQYLILGKGMQGQRTLPQSLAAATLESVIAAIYLDAGMPAARALLVPILTPLIRRAAASGHQENFKSVLQQAAQVRFARSPVYTVLDEKGPDHAKCFEVRVEIDGRKFPSCWGNSKKAAEQSAALAALTELGLTTDHEGHIRILLDALATPAPATPPAPTDAPAAR
jgi:ribonuclease-3